jgi:hypothetical protein
MSNKLDTLGLILWYMVFLTPFITIPIAWRILPIRKAYRVLFGLLMAPLFSFILYFISLAILFRNGMGPR